MIIKTFGFKNVDLCIGTLLNTIKQNFSRLSVCRFVGDRQTKVPTLF